MIMEGMSISGCPDRAFFGQPPEVEAAGKKEYRAYWFCYDDFKAYRRNNKVSAVTFERYFTKVIKNGKSLGMNTIIVQVRPFSDAVYRSSYYPWAECISGKQGRSPGFDPLKIMVSVAHKNKMKIEAWINPYRVTAGSTSYKSLAKTNPARKWHNKKGKKRNVLAYFGNIYYNPSKSDVRKLIVNGVTEIVKNYDVDGIHMDDYFYPYFSRANVRNSFDAREYRKSADKRRGMSIARYRRKQVNTLVRQIYKAVKKENPKVTFGISPAGELTELRSNYAHYADVDTWVRSSSYIDYICPQVYWGFRHPTAAFDKVTNRWCRLMKGSPVRLYIGIAAYKVRTGMGVGREYREWKKNSNILKKEVVYARKKKVDGFAFFDYADLVRKKNKKAVRKLKKVLK